MPRRRSRSSLGPTGTQSTLSFSNSKVHKPTSAKEALSKSTAKFISSPKAEHTLDLGHITSAAAVASQAAIELAKPVKEKSIEELQAEKLTDGQIKKYWKAREAERQAPRVHQAGLGVEEKILRLFDMSSQYGPAIGIARMKRWVRANKLGLAPPIEVLAVLLREEKKGNTGIERAHVDELMSAKFVIGDT
ncbi:putative DNA polymerase delta subunit 4 [Calycina marina]|uniref:DNA polymerase delta subunit 4 n=1 Tax=Calycina marina TaxID=1763456 RepID=A0A9P7ZBX2_9HELO|nr:putative DNA polymerase delta subunit 4 [Calycina marina]